jgi:hypothetical protein
MEANMQNPMTTKEAVDKHECSVCREQGSGSSACGFDCVESATCSLRCKACNERNWFTGDLPRERKDWQFDCVKCGKHNKF